MTFDFEVILKVTFSYHEYRQDRSMRLALKSGSLAGFVKPYI